MHSSLPFLHRNTVFKAMGDDWTVEDWEQLPGDELRCEIIAGSLYISTLTSSYHQWVSQKVYFALREQVDDTESGYTIHNLSVFMPGCQPIVPDLLTVRREDRHYFNRGYVYGVPALLVEVLAPGSVAYDMQVKREVYALAGVPEYWIVRPKERDILVHTLPDSDTGLYLQVTHVPPDGELVSPTLPFRAAIAGFFAGAPDTTL